MRVLHSYDELPSLADRPVHLTVGFFDGVHLGHQHLLAQLQAAAQEAGAQSLALTFSNSPRRFHQPQLSGPEWHYLTTADEKIELLATTGIDATLMLRYDESVASQTAQGFLEGLATVASLAGLYVGYDTSMGRDMLTGREAFSSLCGRLGIGFTWVEPLLVDGTAVKSSLVRELVQAGEMARARQLLGRPYTLRGPVVRGKGKGREMLGIPTANLELPAEKLLPPLGVYSGMARVGLASYPAAICLSSREQHAHTALEGTGGPEYSDNIWEQGAVPEAHLIGFEGDLYGQTVTLQLTQRLRGWQSFASVAELQQQMLEDIRVVTNLAEGAD